MAAIAGYCRVSSEEQAVNGISIEAQQQLLRSWVATCQRGEIHIYSDPGYSGKSTARPALQELLADCRAGKYDTVVVWKLDRLSRSLRDTLEIIEDVFSRASVSLISITEAIDTSSPSGRMMLHMLASFAQLEREQDSDRVLMAHRHLAEDCRYLGGHIPLGYRVDERKHYQLDPATSPVVRKVFEKYLAREGYAEILRFLNEHVSAFGHRKNPFNKTDLNYLLSNEFYAGVYLRRLGRQQIRIPDGVPAILSAGEWAEVCRIRAENRAGDWRASRTKRVDLLTGLMVCGSCGRKLRIDYAGKDRDGTNQRYYYCPRCEHFKRLRVERAETAVLAALSALAGEPETIRRACDVANGYAQSAHEDNAADAAALELKLKELGKRRASIVDFVAAAGADAPASLAQELRRLDADSDHLRQRIERLRRPPRRFRADPLIADLAIIQKQKDELPRDQLKAVVHRVVHTVASQGEELSLVLTGYCDVEMTHLNIVASLSAYSSSDVTLSVREGMKIYAAETVMLSGPALSRVYSRR